VGPNTTWREVQWTKVRVLIRIFGLRPWYCGWWPEVRVLLLLLLLLVELLGTMHGCYSNVQRLYFWLASTISPVVCMNVSA
jgi:hypothetical protein